MTALSKAIERVEQFKLHPLGFFYLRDDLKGGLANRTHVWLPGGADGADNDLHTHSFRLLSAIKAGRMKNEIFRFDPSQAGTHIEHAVTYRGSVSALEATGRTGNLVTVATFETPSGSTYTLEAGVVHRATVLERPCVTLVQTLEQGAPILSYGRTEETPFDRRVCTDREAQSIYDALMGIHAD